MQGHGVYTITSDLDGSAASSSVQWKGGKGLFILEFGTAAGTVALQMTSPAGTWINVPNNSGTVNGLSNFDLPQCRLRVNSTNAGNVDVKAWIAAVEI